MPGKVHAGSVCVPKSTRNPSGEREILEHRKLLCCVIHTAAPNTFKQYFPNSTFSHVKLHSQECNISNYLTMSAKL